MRKEDMLSKNQIMHVRTEREILTSAKIPWIVNLKYSFQDENYLYLVMDYLPGGDLMSLLMNKNILTENESKFYIAELILAVESVHKLNCIHRDLKPDNILINKEGHIQLSDFGLSKMSVYYYFILYTKFISF
jgi:serine/threonine kinase 38